MMSVLVLQNQLIAGLVGRQVELNLRGGRTQSQEGAPISSAPAGTPWLRACTEENVTTVGELVGLLSQEGQKQTHY